MNEQNMELNGLIAQERDGPAGKLPRGSAQMISCPPPPSSRGCTATVAMNPERLPWLQPNEYKLATVGTNKQLQYVYLQYPKLFF